MSAKTPSKQSPKKKSLQKLIVFALLVVAIIAFFAFDLSHYLSFAYLKENQL